MKSLLFRTTEIIEIFMKKPITYLLDCNPALRQSGLFTTVMLKKIGNVSKLEQQLNREKTMMKQRALAGILLIQAEFLSLKII